ncbi:MAG TPA: DNA starvation/stationary phase protection protein [Bacteroidaceae bacterium]|nr:DNA starvation/stationary phase protection protein [Bacteroidaceae bacterium]
MKKETYIMNSEIQKELNRLLSDYQIYYQNLRAFHWLVKGQQFFHLHEKFEEYYDGAAEDIDEIAERVLMIGGKPLHTFEDYLKHATLKPEKDLEKPADILPKVIANVEHLLASFRNVLDLAGEAGDEGTAALMSDFIGAAEKQLWMLKSIHKA